MSSKKGRGYRSASFNTKPVGSNLPNVKREPKPSVSPNRLVKTEEPAVSTSSLGDAFGIPSSSVYDENFKPSSFPPSQSPRASSSSSRSRSRSPSRDISLVRTSFVFLREMNVEKRYEYLLYTLHKSLNQFPMAFLLASTQSFAKYNLMEIVETLVKHVDLYERTIKKEEEPQEERTPLPKTWGGLEELLERLDHLDRSYLDQAQNFEKYFFQPLTELLLRMDQVRQELFLPNQNLYTVSPVHLEDRPYDSVRELAHSSNSRQRYLSSDALVVLGREQKRHQPLDHGVQPKVSTYVPRFAPMVPSPEQFLQQLDVKKDGFYRLGMHGAPSFERRQVNGMIFILPPFMTMALNEMGEISSSLPFSTQELYFVSSNSMEKAIDYFQKNFETLYQREPWYELCVQQTRNKSFQYMLMIEFLKLLFGSSFTTWVSQRDTRPLLPPLVLEDRPVRLTVSPHTPMASILEQNLQNFSQGFEQYFLQDRFYKKHCRLMYSSVVLYMSSRLPHFQWNNMTGGSDETGGGDEQEHSELFGGFFSSEKKLSSAAAKQRLQQLQKNQMYLQSFEAYKRHGPREDEEDEDMYAAAGPQQPQPYLYYQTGASSSSSSSSSSKPSNILDLGEDDDERLSQNRGPAFDQRQQFNSVARWLDEEEEGVESLATTTSSSIASASSDVSFITSINLQTTGSDSSSSSSSLRTDGSSSSSSSSSFDIDSSMTSRLSKQTLSSMYMNRSEFLDDGNQKFIKAWRPYWLLVSKVQIRYRSFHSSAPGLVLPAELLELGMHTSATIMDLNSYLEASAAARL